MPCKITLIGAGSVVFAKKLISDLLQFPELSDSTICLMDIDPDRLRVADVMTRRIVAKLGVGAKVVSTLDQRKAVKGAKYVICTIQVGGFRPSTVRDFEIPKKYGLRQTIADTLGVGGVFRALRTIPVLVDIAKDIAEVGHPDCLFLNYTNPMAMNCWAVDRAVGVPHVGLCHSVFGTARQLCRFANLPYEDVSYLVAGVNHMAFFLKFQYKGQDAYPLLFKALEDPERDGELVRFEMMRRLGYFVTESSEHQSEYTPYFIHHGEEMIEKYKIPLDEYIRRCEAILASWKDEEKKLLGSDKGEIPIQPRSEEYGTYIIHSLETDTLRTIYGNVPNRHIIDNLPIGCNIEVPCQVDATGLHPLRIGELPPQLAAICNTQVQVQGLTVEAALSGKREHIYHAVMADPHTAASLPLDQIWAMCDELIEAHQKDGYLGEYSDVLRNTGRGYDPIGSTVIARAEGEGSLKTRKGARNQLRIAVENPGEEAVKIPLRWKSDTDAVRVIGKSKRNCAVAAGKTVYIDAEIENLEEISGDVRILLESSAPGVLCVDALLQPRRALVSRENGTVPFSFHLNGMEAVEGTLIMAKDGLELQAHVLDSKPEASKGQPDKGSFVEFAFATDEDSKIGRIFVVPDPTSKTVAVRTAKGKDIPIEQVTAKFTKMKYSFSILLPWKAAGLSAESKRFLFDAQAKLEALGDAHSGGKCALSGAFHSTADHARLSEVRLISPFAPLPTQSQ